MLRKINSLNLFFKDNYRRINIREYGRLQNISPPTASKFLASFQKSGLLKKEEHKQYLYYYANKENSLFIELSRIYWKSVLEKIGIIDFLEKELLTPIIILFGSISKAEARPESDIDLAIFTTSDKNIKLNKFEKKLNKNIQLFIFKTRKDVKNPELLNNILNGYKIKGAWQ